MPGGGGQTTSPPSSTTHPNTVPSLETVLNELKSRKHDIDRVREKMEALRVSC